MAENGSGEDSKRDEGGRFLPGCAGGPGRGKKSDEYDLSDAGSWEAAKRVFLRGIQSGNENIRLKAAKFLLDWLDKKAAHEAKTRPAQPIPPVIEAWLQDREQADEAIDAEYQGIG